MFQYKRDIWMIWIFVLWPLYWYRRAKYFEGLAEKIMQLEIAKALRPQLNSEKIQEVILETWNEKAG